MERVKIRFTVQGGASFIRTFAMTSDDALAFCRSRLGQESVLRRAGHVQRSRSMYEMYDRFPSCVVEIV